jgi:hypothetical protein
MDNKLINQVIQLSSKEEKLGKFGPMAKIKDEKGLTYNVYKLKKDGTVSVAWEQLQGLNTGEMTQISFAEEIVNHPEHGTYTSRIARAFNPDIGNGMVNSSAQEKSSNVGHSGSFQGHSDAFSRRLGVQGHINALLSNPSYYPISNDADLVPIASLIKEAIAIEDEAEKQLSSSLEDANLNLPVIQQGDDVDVDSIPF